MPDYVTKNVPLFFYSDDERLLERELKKVFPNLVFVDGSLWDSTSPPIKESLADCRNDIVFLWNRDVCPQLPYKVLDNGKVRGPTSGVVIQLCRSKLNNEHLLSGDIGIGYDKNNASISSFVSDVWKVLKAINTRPLESFDKASGQTIERGIRDYIVGPDASRLSSNGIVLKHCAADAYYRSKQQIDEKE